MSKYNRVESDIIDVHAHIGWYHPDYMAGTDQDLLLRAEVAGITMTCISSLEAICYPKFEDGSDNDLFSGNEVVRKAVDEHDELLMWVALHPKIENSWPQVEEYLSHPKCLGIKVHPSQHGYAFDDYADDVFKLAGKYNKGILTHSYDDNFCNPNQICPAAKNYPEVPIIMAHIGFSKDRNNRTIHIDVAKKYNLPNVYLDTSSLNICFNGILELAVEELGSSNILFGTDSLQHFPAAIAERVRCALISDDDKHNILHLNAERLIEKLLAE